MRCGSQLGRAAAALAAATLARCAPVDRVAELDLAGSTVAVRPANVAAGGSAPAQVTVSARRGDGVRIADGRLRLALRADGCAVDPTAATPAADGTVAFTVRGCGPGTHLLQVRATLGDVSQLLAATSSLNVYQPAASDADAIAGGSPLSLAFDAGYSFAGPVAFVSSDPLATLPGPVQLDAARHGVAVLARQAVLRTPGPQTVSALDVASGQVLITEAFTVVAAAAGADQARLVVTAPAQARAGQAVSVAVRAVDAAGHAAPVTTGTVVLISDDPQATLPVARAAGAGVAVFDGVVLRRAGPATLTAQASGGAAGSATLQVAPAAMVTLSLARAAVPLWAAPGAASLSPIRAAVSLWAASDAASPPVTAGQAVTVSIAARDAYGNLATDFAGAVTLQSSDPAAVLPPPIQFSAGVAQERAATALLATAGPQTLTAVAANGMRATLPTLQVVPGPPSRLQLTVPPGAVVGTPVAGLTLAIADTFGNAVAGYVGPTLLTSDDATATLPPAPSFAAGAAGPLALGAATFPHPGPVLLRAETVPAGALAAARVIVTVAPAAADPGHVTLTSGSGSTAADGVSQARLTLRVADVSDYPIPGHAVQLSVNGGATLSPQPAPGSTTVSTDAAGEVAIAVSSVHAGSAQLTVAVAPGVTRVATVSFVAGTAAAARSQLQASPSAQLADNVHSIALVVAAADAQGNPVPGAPVRLRSSDGGDTISPSTGVTDATGALAASLRGSAAGPRVLTAVLPGATVAQAVTLLPGPAAAANTTLTASPQVQAADGVQASTLTLLAVDGLGNPASGQPVALSVSGSGNLLGAASGLTDARGLFVTTLRASLRETKHVTALVGAVSVGATVTFVSGAAVAAQSALNASPSALPADGVASSLLTLTARDAQGAPAVGRTVTVLPPGPGITVIPTSGLTDAQGTFTATATSTRAGAAAVVVATGGGQLAATLQWQAGAPTAAASQLRLAPLVQVADGVASALVTLQLADRFDNPVPGVSAALSSAGSGDVVQTLAPATDSAGRLSATLQSTVAGTKLLTAQVPAVGSAPGFTLRAGARFVAGVPASARTTVTALPGSAVADGAATLVLTVNAADAQGNVVAAAPVTWSVGGSGATLTPGAPVTDASGQATASLAATTVGGRIVTAQVQAAVATVAVSFTAGGVDGASSSWAASPTTVVADGVATAQLTATARDIGARPLTNVYVGVSASGSGNTLDAAGGFTDADGHFVTTLHATHAEAKTVTANIGGATQSITVTFVPGQPAAVGSQIALVPTTAPADGSSTLGVQILLADAQGNPTPGIGVALAASGTGVVLSPTHGITAADGSLTATLSSTVAESKAVTAGFSGQQLTATASFSAGAPAAAQSQLTLTGSPAAADGSAALGLAVHLGDAQGNPVANTTVALASSGSGNAIAPIYPLSGTTDLAGNLQAALRSTVAEAKTVTATAAGLTLSAGGAFMPGPAVAATSAVTALPAGPVADGSATTTLTATLRDAQGNPVSGQALTFACSGTGNALSSSSATTGAGGVATVTLSSTRAESKTVTVSFAGTSVTAGVSFVAGPVAAAQSAVTASPTTRIADGSSAATVTVLARDATGNAAAGQPVSLASSGSGNVLSPTSGTTDVAGTFAAQLTSTVVETKTLTATVAGVSVSGSVAFVPGGPAAARSSLAPSPASCTADGATASTLTLRVADAENNPVPGAAVSFTVDGSHNTLSPSSGVTSATGLLTTTLVSTTAQLATVTATFAGRQVSAQVAFVAGAPVQATSSVTSSPSSVVADGGSTAAIAVVLRDAQGNTVPGVAVTLSSSGTGNTMAPTAGTTDASGTLTATLASTVAGTKTVTAGFAATSVAGAASFVAGPPTAATSSLSVSPAAVTADGSTTATLTALLRDAQGNLVAGAPVTLAASGSNNTLTPSSGVTAADGTLVATAASTKAEAKTLTASFAATQVTAPVSFIAGAAATATSTLSVSPASLGANGTSAATITVHAADAQNNPAAGQAVALAASGSANTLAPSSGTANAAGNFVATIKSTVAEAKTVTATMGGASASGGVTFTPTAATGATSTLAASPASFVADGAATTTLTTTVRDASSNAIAGQAVALSVTGTGNTITPASGTTDTNGQFSATLASTAAQSKTVTATFSAASTTAVVTATAGPPATALSQLSASPTSMVADGSTTTTVTAVIRDANGNPVSGQAVTFSSSGVNNTWSATSGTTNAGGSVAVTLKSITAEAKTLTATAAAAAPTTTVTTVAGAATSANSTVSAAPATVTADGTSTAALTAVIRDAFNNPLNAKTVSLTAAGTGNMFTPSSGSTNASGQFNATLASTQAVAKTITWSFAPGSGTASVTFVPGPPASATSTVSFAPTTLTADGTTTTTVTATVRDAAGNVVPNAAVSVGASGSANTFAATSGTANAVGVWTTTLASTAAQAKTVTATSGAASFSQGVTFVAGPATTANSTFGLAPTSVPFDGNGRATVTATLRDAYNNVCAGAAAALTSSIGNDFASPAYGVADASGVFVGSVTPSSTSSRTVTLTSGSATLSGSFSATSAAACNGTPLLGAPPMLALSGDYLNVGIGDLDGDGKNDLCVPNRSTNVLNMFRGHGTGLFDAAVALSPTGLTGPAACLFADLDGDGRLDVITANGTNNRVAVLRNAGSGTLAAPVLSTTSGNVYEVLVGEMTGDAYVDVVAVPWQLAKVDIFPGSSTGTLGAAQTTTVAGNPNLTSFALADFDHDGRLDIVASDYLGGKIVYLRGLGASGLAPPATTATGGTNPIGIAAADFDQDGNLDVSVANSGSANTALLLGAGNGTFAAASLTTVGATPESLVAADVTADGRPDVVSYSVGTATQNVQPALAGGAFSSTVAIGMPSASPCCVPRIFALGAVNGDARPDLVTAYRAAQVATISLGGGGSFYTPLFSGNGGSGTNTVAVADFDNDGILDAVTGTSSYPAYIQKGDGAGNFGAAQFITTGTTCAPQGVNGMVAAADFNADGKMDFVRGYNNINTDCRGAFYNLGNGTGGFAAEVRLAATGLSAFPVVADVDVDGKPDVITVGAYYSYALSVFKNAGGGTFNAEVAYSVDTGALYAVAADFNNDGKPDIATTTNGTSTWVDLFLNTGTGTFSAFTHFTVAANKQHLQSADFNQDGKRDLVFSSNTNGTLSVVLGNGNGTFGSEVVIDSACPQANLIALGDVNGDGLPDVVTTSSTTLHVLLSKGDGTFSPARVYGVGKGTPAQAVLADVNGDGKLDAVVATSGGAEGITVLLNRGCLF